MIIVKVILILLIAIVTSAIIEITVNNGHCSNSSNNSKNDSGFRV